MMTNEISRVTLFGSHLVVRLKLIMAESLVLVLCNVTICKVRRACVEILCVAYVAFPTSVYAANWEVIADRRDPNLKIELDTSAILRKGDEVQALLRSTGQESADIAHVLLTIAYRCSERREKTIRVEFVKHVGKTIVQTFGEKESRWHPVSIDSVTGEGFKAVCKR